MPIDARKITLDCCIHERGLTIDLKVVVVMPDHVHMIFTPLIDKERSEVIPLARITKSIKGASAHLINKRIGHTGTVWQEESFDHVLRSSESLDQKIQYVIENPVRRGLVQECSEYPWLWRCPVEYLSLPGVTLT